MKKYLLSMCVLLVGCLSTSNRNPMHRDVADVTSTSSAAAVTSCADCRSLDSRVDYLEGRVLKLENFLFFDDVHMEPF